MKSAEPELRVRREMVLVLIIYPGSTALALGTPWGPPRMGGGEHIGEGTEG